MRFEVDELENRRRRHTAWRLLRYQHAPLAVAFLHKCFIAGNTRSLPEAQGIDLLDDLLFATRQMPNSDPVADDMITDPVTQKSAKDYIADWSAETRGFIRRFYGPGDDEPQIAITPGAERALAWLASLDETGFVGTESRLLLAIELLRQLDVQTNPDAETRLADLYKRRAEIDAEIAQVQRGDVPVLDDRTVLERFHQFADLGRDLLADFRQVEENFRALDRSVRERVAQWEGSKGALLSEIFGERDLITSSDQGASFRAFWELLSPIQHQDELTERLSRVLSHPVVVGTSPDRRMRHLHHDWFDAGDHTQRTVASLSAQLRRFIDETAWLENRRIIEIVRAIEHHAIELREEPPKGNVTTVATPSADISLPMERRLGAPPTDNSLHIGDILNDDDADLTQLFTDTNIDVIALADHVDELLIDRSQVTLASVCESRPITHGLGELVAYLHLADDRFDHTVINEHRDRITWELSDPPVVRTVNMPRVIFVRREPEWA
jgi:hypothetical protein